MHFDFSDSFNFRYYTNKDDATSMNNTLFVLNSTGALINGTVTASSFNTTSDYRVKGNAVELKDTNFTIDNLKPVYYYNKKTEKNDIGLIAHEVQQEFPFLVNGIKDGDEMQSVNYIGLIAVLINEIQELKSKLNIYGII